MKTLNVGVIGCGEIAGHIALVSKLIPRVKLSACCDVVAERARVFAKRHRIPLIYSDYNEMLANAPLDAIYLAVPHHHHYQMVLSAVNIGKPVLVEKPLTRTLEEGIMLIEMTTGQKVGVNYQYRYDKGCYALVRAV
jgi:predicted dehydrogenase